MIRRLKGCVDAAVAGVVLSASGWWANLPLAGVVGLALVGVVVGAARQSGSWFTASRYREFLGIAGVLVTVAALRAPSQLVSPQLWAEDGVIFFADAWRCGIDAVSYRYAGYLHVAPRLAAWAAVNGPRTWLPSLFVIGSLAALLVVGYLLASRRVPVPWSAKVLMAAAILLPPTTAEVILRLVNIQWPLALALVLVALADPPKRWTGVAGEAVCLFVCGLSGPFLVFLLPVFWLRAALVRDRGSLIRAALATVPAVVQAAQVLVAGRSAVRWSLSAVELVGRGLASSLGGATVNLPAGLPYGGVIVVAASVAVMTLILARGWRRANVPAVLTVTAAAALLAAWVLVGLTQPSLVMAERYRFLPVVLLFWAAILAWPASRVPGVVLLAVVALNVRAFALPALADVDWARHSACLEEPGPCVIPLNPVGWSVDMRAADAPGRAICGSRD